MKCKSLQRIATKLLSLDGRSFHGTEERILLGLGLEATVAELGRGIDKLELDLLESRALDLRDESLAESKDTLDSTKSSTLDHDEVLVDLTILRETTERGDVLVSKIVGSGGVEARGSDALTINQGASGSTNTVDLLVDLSTVEVTLLTSAGDGPLDTSRVPSTDTSNLAETTVSLAGKTSNTPTRDDTLVTMTTGDTEDIDHLVLREDRGNRDGLLEELLGPSDLVRDRATVDLDLNEVSLLLAETDELRLSVSEDADNLSILLHAGKLAVNILVIRSGNAGSITVEGLLLGAVPVLVEAALNGLVKVRSPDGVEGTETAGSLNITDETNDDHGGSLDDGDGLDDLTLVKLRARLVDLTENVSHTSLEAHEGGEVGLLRLIIAREASHATAVVLSTLAGRETERAVTGLLELTVRHFA